jgi:lipoprotein-releasing system ATP-binding protein
VETSILLRLTDVSKTFAGRAGAVDVLRDVSLEVGRGQSIAITGPSGSGKSTLLHVIGTLDPPSSGTVTIDGDDPFTLSEPDLARFRNRVVGFVFQQYHLLPQYSVLENVLIPTQAFRDANDDAEERARSLLERVGLGDRLDHRPAELSGGEQQRTAIARALINRPALLLCDEPTGNLDHSTASTAASLLFDLHQDPHLDPQQAERMTLVVATHSVELARACERHFELRDGTCAEA